MHLRSSSASLLSFLFCESKRIHFYLDAHATCLRPGTNMSCNGCRVLRKGCSETCILRPCLQWIPTPEAQGHATVFVAKFFGRAGLISFISAVPESQRPSLFQSLLFEACGRTVNPVTGAVGLLWTGNWNVCQTAVETVLGGGTLLTIPDLVAGGSPAPPSDEDSEAEVACTDMWKLQEWKPNSRFSNSRSRPLIKRKRADEVAKLPLTDLDLRLTSGLPSKISCELQRPETPSRNSEESVTTSCIELDLGDRKGDVGNEKLLNLFI